MVLKEKTEKEEWFRDHFKKVTGYDPFPWQERLFLSLLQGEIPFSIDIPTGCGKTKVMVIWLLALAYQAQNGNIQLPRRLIWIVNRRTIVDQATEEAEEIAEKVQSIQSLKELLALISVLGNEEPVVVSTLRGEHADNEKWKEDPSRPAIIVGTVDMIGSKLLFRGYGDGRWKRPYHAGLLGIDSMLVLDEVHLVPAFEKLLLKIKELNRSKVPRPFCVVFVGATLRRKKGETLTLSEEDERNSEISRRISARKTLRLHEEKEVRKAILEKALEYRDKKCRIAVFVKSPEDAQQIANELKKKAENRVLLLTGEIRGYERDLLVKSPLFRQFHFKEQTDKVENTIYFVSTSAGEVGIDLNVDHCVCDLASIDSLIQRFGRVNRGGRTESVIDLFYGDKKEMEDSERKTLDFLLEKGENIDVSPQAIRKWKIQDSLFSPEPFSPDLTFNELELWSMTSVHDEELDPNGKYKVEYWLHGNEEKEPEIFLVWREDVEYLARLLPERAEEVEEILTDFYHPFSKEKLRIPIKKFAKFCRKLIKVFASERKEMYVLVLKGTKVEKLKLEELEEKLEDELSFSTLFLPLEVGGLNDQGYLDEEWIGRRRKHLDVADEALVEGLERRRLFCRQEGLRWRVRKLGEEKEEEVEDLNEYLTKNFRGWARRTISFEEQPEPEKLIYLKKFEPEFDESPKEVLLEEHSKDAEKFASEICQKLGFPPNLGEIIKRAARLHDEGKRLKDWQEKVMGNLHPTPQNLLAKCPEKKSEKFHYRHEIGSLLLAREKHPDDLLLHLIAASHGRARPLFEENTFPHPHETEYIGVCTLSLSREEEWELRKECARRFHKLQIEWGYFGLAYLESIVKAADVLASRGKAKHDRD
ncbi:MAG: type I-U CRISPR-associated helicase/endonuclease Cas3 [Candidatus Hadarchaeales archaeon]